jgi:hypothetical protein
VVWLHDSPASDTTQGLSATITLGIGGRKAWLTFVRPCSGRGIKRPLNNIFGKTRCEKDTCT